MPAGSLARVVAVDGELGVWVRGTEAGEFVELLERAHAQHVRGGRLPIELVLDVVEAIRGLAGLRSLAGRAACGTEPSGVVADPASSLLMTTSEVADHDGVAVRTVRKRIDAGRYPNRVRAGRDWLIPASDVIEEARA